MRAPTMPEIRQAIEQARALEGREDTEAFALQTPGLLARLVQILDLYVGHEPTLAEEEAYVRQQHRAEVLREAASAVETMWLPAATRLRRMAAAEPAGKDTREGESTQPVPALVWHVYEEDAPPPDHPRLFTTKAAAEQGTIDLYQEMGNHSPDYSWRPAEDGAHELLAGAEPVGIYLAPVPVRDTPPDLVALADFFEPGHTYTDEQYPTYDWAFRCDTVTVHPEDGERTALGWRRFRGQWTPYAYGEDDWDVHRYVGVVDTAEGGEPR